MHVWDIKSGGELEIPKIKATVSSGLAFLPDSRRLLFINDESRIEIRDVNAPQTTVVKFGNLPDEMSDITISGNVDLAADGSWLVAYGTLLTIWDIESQQLVLALPEEQGTVTAAWNSDQTRLAVGSNMGEIAVWKLAAIRDELTQIGLGW